jgi:pyrroline-5-carboxylate reductase
VQERLDELMAAHPGLSTCLHGSAADLYGKDVIVLGVEPKDMQGVCSKWTSQEPSIFVSLAAGVTLEALGSWLPKDFSGKTRIVRVMPNTPCTVGAMAAGYCCNEACSPADAAIVGSLLGALGSALRVEDEADLDAVTGVSGSGPAYVFQFIEAMSDGGVRCGLSRQVATRLAAQTVLGAGKMVLETNMHPGALKDMVTSPGGTTIAAVHALEKGGLRAAVIDAVVAATERSRELGAAGAAATKRGAAGKRARSE